MTGDLPQGVLPGLTGLPSQLPVLSQSVGGELKKEKILIMILENAKAKNTRKTEPALPKTPVCCEVAGSSLRGARLTEVLQNTFLLQGDL